MGGDNQSPLIAEDMAMIHKRSESVTNQRPPDSILQQVAQGNRGNNMQQNNANVNLYQKYSTNVVAK